MDCFLDPLKIWWYFLGTIYKDDMLGILPAVRKKQKQRM